MISLKISLTKDEESIFVKRERESGGEV